MTGRPKQPEGVPASIRGVLPVGLAIALLLAGSGGALAFPLVGSDVSDAVPSGSELSPSDLQDLQHQLQLSSGLPLAPSGGGWTFTPRIDWQEEVTDNALQANSPRVADLVTYIAPGIGVAGDLQRLQLTLDWSPVLTTYARNSGLNSLTQQLSALGNVTLAQDLAYVDVRAMSGVSSMYAGGGGGLGNIGALSAISQAGLAGNAIGLNRNNEVQTSSFGVSPYLMGHFGDWGDGRVGYSLNASSSDMLQGFASSPFPSGGANSQQMVSNEETAHFVTGDALQFLQNAVDVDMYQASTQIGTEAGATLTGSTSVPGHNFNNTRSTASDMVTYVVNRHVSVFASGGYEDIEYSGGEAAPIRDLTWSFGTTLSGPKTMLTVSYGHQNGANSLAANGSYALTPRTLLTVSYGSTLGTQLQAAEDQLNLTQVGSTGSLVNGQSNAPLYAFNNVTGLSDTVLRTKSLTAGVTTLLDRDQFALNFTLADQTSVTPGTSYSSDTATATFTWTHQMRPDMTLIGTVSYSLQDMSTGASTTPILFDGVVIGVVQTPGHSSPTSSTTWSGSMVWQWQLSDATSASVRYAYYDRRSPYVLYDMYANMLILGISKRF